MMMNVSSNLTAEHCSKIPAFTNNTEYIVILSLFNIVPFLVGQSLIAKLLWITFNSRKTRDILNLNLAFINFLHYWISIVHLHFLFLWKGYQHKILKFLLLYGQIGGPMSLFFICLERYIAVVHPMHFQLLKTYRFREVSSVIVWCFTLPLAFIYFANSVALEFFSDNVYDIPFCLLVVTTIMIIHCSITMASLLMQPGPGNRKIHPAKKKAFKTICTIMLIVLTCYSPVRLLQRVKFKEDTYKFKIVPLCVFFVVCHKYNAPTSLSFCPREALCFLEKIHKIQMIYLVVFYLSIISHLKMTSDIQLCRRKGM